MTTLNAFEEQSSAQAEEPRDPAQAGPGGLTLPVLALAAIVASPAIYQCLVTHTVPVQVMLERYVLIALGCLLVSEVVRRMLWPSAPAARTAPTVSTVSTVSTGPADPANLSTDPAEVSARPAEG